MLVFKIDARLLHRVLRSIPPLDEFCIVYIEGSQLGVICKNPENTLAVQATIRGVSFHYILSYDLTFAVNLGKIRAFVDGIPHSGTVGAVLDEDRGYLILSSGPLVREIRSLHPDAVDLVRIHVPPGYGTGINTTSAEMSVISRGLAQVDPTVRVNLTGGTMAFHSVLGGETFSYSREIPVKWEDRVELAISVENLRTVADHLIHSRSVLLHLKEDSSIIVSSRIDDGSEVRYLMARIGEG